MMDVTIRIFSLLSHTPINDLGINFDGHWKCEDDAQTILRKLFAGGHESFQKVLGNGYQVGGVITSHQESRKITLRFEVSNKIENGIFFNVNFHRDISTRQAEQAIQIISENYEKDLEDVINIAKELIGEPEETWKPKQE